jgi:hypothetical protein
MSDKSKTTDAVTGFKGFDKDLKCKGFQYEVGKTYTHDGKVQLCKTGFHFCENPWDTLSYYPIESGNRYAQTEAQGVMDEREKDSKRVSSVLAIKAELTIKSLIDCAVKFTLNLAKSTPTGKVESYSTGYSGHAASTGYSGHAASTGNSGHAASTGYSGHAASTGYSGHAASTGNYGHAASTGDYGHAASTGNSGHASALGKGSIAAAIGRDGMAKAALGNWIVLAEYTEDCTIRWVKTVKIDGKTRKADTFYTLKNGKFVEVEP